MVQGPSGTLNGWNYSDESPCDWRGVVCDNVTNHVIRINLPRARLTGTISPRLSELSQLRRLGLHANNITGAIPSFLVNLTYLRTLYLHNNNLTETLPDVLGIMPALRILDVSGNKIEGPIPATFSAMNKLKFLNLSNNRLSGEVPGGSMLRFPASSFAGNSLLCGSSLLGLPACKPEEETKTDHKGSRWSAWKILVLSIGIFLLLKMIIALLILCHCLRQDRKREIQLGKEGKLVMFRGETVPKSKAMLQAVRKLRKRDIVGEGGYGVVYKTVLKDGRVFAVKKLKNCLEAAIDFENELEALAELKHRNLVKLRGYCVSPTSKFLIYDFIPNGTVDQLLHPRTEEGEKGNPVDWATRIKIARGTARALACLHHDCQPRIIHRDVSSKNILLNERFEPCLSDFGLARLMENDHTHVTASVGGTYGYIAPEYAQAGRATEKSDVYSYGVILLELLSRRKPTDSSFSAHHINMAGWLRCLREKGQELEVVEKYLRETAPHQELAIALEIACRCVSLTPEERPPMDEVVQILESLANSSESTQPTVTETTATSNET